MGVLSSCIATVVVALVTLPFDGGWERLPGTRARYQGLVESSDASRRAWVLLPEAVGSQAQEEKDWPYTLRLVEFDCRRHRIRVMLGVAFDAQHKALERTAGGEWFSPPPGTEGEAELEAICSIGSGEPASANDTGSLGAAIHV